MRFTPKTEEEIARENMLTPGIYDFEVGAAEDTISKAGNDMMKLTLRVFDTDGTAHTLFDYLLEAGAYKLRHFAEGCGLLAEYARGELQDFMVVGKTGRCKVSIQKDKTGNFPDKNGISDYVVANAKPARAAAAVPSSQMPMKGPASDIDDEIPF